MAEDNIRQQVMDAMKAAMKAHEKQRLAVIRLIQADFKQKEVDERIEIDDPVALQLLDKMVKQRRDSIKQFEAGQRADLAEKENFELEVIQEFLPSALSIDEVSVLITQAIQETGAESMKDMGRVMGILKPKLQGRADMGEVSSLIKEKLAG
jgi:uncharacterized protein YqeY